MEGEKGQIENVIAHLNDYFEKRWKLFVLNSSDKASDLISSAASILLITLTATFVLLFLSVGAALWIGNSTGSYSEGFLFVGLFYLLVTIVLFLFRKAFIKIPVINSLLNAFYYDEEDQNN